MENMSTIALIENRKCANNKYANIASKLKKYIDENYQDPNLSVELIADYIGLSPNYTRTIFKEKLGISISDYIIQVRFLKAEQMLQHTDYTIKKIATLVGFYDTRYIYISFKKYFGVTAMEYRRKLNRVATH
jgi:two-component system response regulator YesN